jgi:hypothetical protein
MPAAFDWRSPRTADMLMRLDQEQFAVEFLRRNPAYGEDYRNTQNRIAAGSLSHDAGMARLARRWGLSFPACAQHACMGFARLVETGALARHCHRCART